MSPFQHTAARRRLLNFHPPFITTLAFQHTAARRRLPYVRQPFYDERWVSTHSRPKAAASPKTKPNAQGEVSTHSRPKAAARLPQLYICQYASFNTQPPEGGCRPVSLASTGVCVSTHSRPKAAAC